MTSANGKSSAPMANASSKKKSVRHEDRQAPKKKKEDLPSRAEVTRNGATKVPRQHATRIEPLARDDYVDPTERSAFSDSDLTGRPAREGDDETREDQHQRTMAAAEREERAP